MQVRLNYREPGITEREPDARDSLTEREPKSPMIASQAADDCKPLHVRGRVFWRSPDSQLRSGYALPSSRIRRHSLILIDVLFSSCLPLSTPIRHNASRIGIERLLKAFDPFLMVEAKAPIQSEIEPALCPGRTGGNMSGVTPQVEVLHVSPVNTARLWPLPR